MEEVLRSALPIFANLTDSFVALTDKNGIRLMMIDASGKTISSLLNKKLDAAEKAIREQRMVLAPSELSKDSKLWAIPVGEYAIVVTEDGKRQKQRQLENSLKESLHLIASVLGSEASLFDEVGTVTHSVNPDGSKNESVIGTINQDAYLAMAMFKSQVMESTLVPGAKSILIPITKQVGLALSNVSSKAQEMLKKDKSGAKYTFDNMIGKSAQLNDVKNLCRKIANSHSSVLILGESGTGKELLAHAIHHASSRANNRFIPFNCAAVPANLIESILFGYEPGAFTGGSPGGKKGLILEADKGTLFLDEIGEMDLMLQNRLLRVLQEKEVMPLGSSKAREVDVRFIAATNKNLEELVAEGKFREDLYYRLNVITVHIPPLRDRLEDIEVLTEAFIKEFNLSLNKRITGISSEAMEILKNYSWPGNVRQLRNTIERIANYIDGGEIRCEHLPDYIFNKPAKPKNVVTPLQWKIGPGETLDDAVRNFEKSIIEQVLRETNHDKQEAAKRLGISLTTLWRKLNQVQNLSINGSVKDK